MGTNYYVQEPACPHCQHTPEPLHIGKSSVGWNFMLRVYPDLGINSLLDWESRLEGFAVIIDEYGNTTTYDKLYWIIAGRASRQQTVPDDPSYLAQNYAERSYLGLLRSINRLPNPLEPPNVCTYDLIPYEFS